MVVGVKLLSSGSIASVAETLWGRARTRQSLHLVPPKPLQADPPDRRLLLGLGVLMEPVKPNQMREVTPPRRKLLDTSVPDSSRQPQLDDMWKQNHSLGEKPESPSDGSLRKSSFLSLSPPLSESTESLEELDEEGQQVIETERASSKANARGGVLSKVPMMKVNREPPVEPAARSGLELFCDEHRAHAEAICAKIKPVSVCVGDCCISLMTLCRVGD